MPAKLSFSLFMFCCVWFWFAEITLAQTTVGMGTENPNPNAVLDLVSERLNQGFLMPRFTTAQRTAASFTGKLSSRDNGLLVFDTDEGNFFYWFNDHWQLSAGNHTPNGTVWYTGNTLPDNRQGTNGDFYIHHLSGDLYRKQNDIFSLIGNISVASYTAGPGISISANKEITNTGDLDNTNETITGVSLQSGDILRIQEAGVDHEVDLSSYQKTALDAGNILVGNASNTATPVTVSGDITLNSDGTTTVVGLQGKSLSATSPSSGHVLTWNGSAWVPQAPAKNGSGAVWHSGNNVPNGSNPASAVDGDYYYKTDAEIVYRKISGSWVEQGKWFAPSGNNIKGATITEITTPTLYMGNGKPDDPDSNGKPGDMYYDATDDELYIKDKIDHWKKL